jgi:hypothetical protein
MAGKIIAGIEFTAEQMKDPTRIHPQGNGQTVFNTFVDAILSQAAKSRVILPPPPAPNSGGVRTFDVQPAPMPVQSLKGLEFKVRRNEEDTLDEVHVWWSVPTPAGRRDVIEVVLPEELRQASEAMIDSGENHTTLVFQAALPQALAYFETLWGAGATPIEE